MFSSTLLTPSGKPAANQVVIRVPGWQFFESYETLVAAENTGTGEQFVTSAWATSLTTKRYVAQFLRCDRPKDVRDHLRTGRVRLIEESDLMRRVRWERQP